jgi:hypothetical protein
MSPSGDPGLHSLVSWMAWHMENRDPVLRTRLTDAGVLLAARQRVPGYQPGEYQQALGLARQGVLQAERTRVIGGEDPLSAVLMGAQPPSPEVTVRGRLTVRDAGGNEQTRSVHVNLPWGATLSQAHEALQAAYYDQDDHYAQNTVEEIEIAGPLLFRDRDV